MLMLAIQWCIQTSLQSPPSPYSAPCVDRIFLHVSHLLPRMYIPDNVSSTMKPSWTTLLVACLSPVLSRPHTVAHPNTYCTLETPLSFLSAHFMLSSEQTVLHFTLSRSSVQVTALSTQLVPNKCLHSSKWMSRSK